MITVKTFATFSPFRKIARFRAAFIPQSRRGMHRLSRRGGSSFDQINVDKDRLPLNKYRLEKRIYVNLWPLHYAKAIARYRFERETINSCIVFTDICRACWINTAECIRACAALGAHHLAVFTQVAIAVPRKRGRHAKLACKYAFGTVERGYGEVRA